MCPFTDITRGIGIRLLSDGCLSPFKRPFCLFSAGGHGERETTKRPQPGGALPTDERGVARAMSSSEGDGEDEDEATSEATSEDATSEDEDEEDDGAAPTDGGDHLDASTASVLDAVSLALGAVAQDWRRLTASHEAKSQANQDDADGSSSTRRHCLRDMARRAATHARRAWRVARRSHADCRLCASHPKLVPALLDVMGAVRSDDGKSEARAWRWILRTLLALAATPRGSNAWPSGARALGVAALLDIMPRALKRRAGAAVAEDAVELLRELLLVSALREPREEELQEGAEERTGATGRDTGGENVMEEERGAPQRMAMAMEALHRRWRRMRRKGWGDKGEDWSRVAAHTAAALAGLAAHHGGGASGDVRGIADLVARLPAGKRREGCRFADIIYPVTPEDFLSRTFERRPMLRKAIPGAAERADGLASVLLGRTGEGGVVSGVESQIVIPSTWCACPLVPADCIDPVLAVASGATDEETTLEVDLRRGSRHRVPGLGGPLRHDYDIRLVREGTAAKARGAVVTPHDVLRATATESQPWKGRAEKHLEGYSVAVRGLTLRDPHVACLAAGLSGVATVGANLYITPRGTRGLARHVDDHDVLVLQLRGEKRWKVWSPGKHAQLPRLYSPRPRPPCDGTAPALSLALRTGDILYIPRGWGHEAEAPRRESTHCPREANAVSRNGSVVEHSIHLTLTVEVEPAMEVAGVMHVAVRRACAAAGADSFGHLAEVLLHVALRSLGDTCAALRRSWTSPFDVPADVNETSFIQRAEVYRGNAASGGKESLQKHPLDVSGEHECLLEHERTTAARMKIEAFAAEVFRIVIGAMQSVVRAEGRELNPCCKEIPVESAGQERHEEEGCEDIGGAPGTVEETPSAKRLRSSIAYDDALSKEAHEDCEALIHLANHAQQMLSFDNALALVRAAASGAAENEEDGDPLSWLSWVRHVAPGLDKASLHLLRRGNACEDVVRAAAQEEDRLRGAFYVLLANVACGCKGRGEEGEGITRSCDWREAWKGAVENARGVMRMIHEGRKRFAGAMRVLQVREG